jgi:hypothetical protein
VHAASDRGPKIGKRGAAALLAFLSVILAACGASGSDNPALPSPQPGPGQAAVVDPGPPVHVVSLHGTPVPQLPANYATLDSGLLATAAGLHGTCRVTTTRDNAGLASFRWVCGPTIATATFRLSDGRRLALSDLLGRDYPTYLSTTAVTQLQAEGKPTIGSTDLSRWDLTPAALEITFPGGTVAFPLSSLSAYVKGPLGS